MKKKKLSKKLTVNKQTISNLSEVRGGVNPTFQAMSGDPCVLQSGCTCNPTFQAVSGDPCVLQSGCTCPICPGGK